MDFEKKEGSEFTSFIAEIYSSFFRLGANSARFIYGKPRDILFFFDDL